MFSIALCNYFGVSASSSVSSSFFGIYRKSLLKPFQLKILRLIGKKTRFTYETERKSENKSRIIKLEE